MRAPSLNRRASGLLLKGLPMSCLLTSCLLLSSCASDLTQLMVVVDSDLAIPSEVDELRITVDATAIGGEVTVRNVPLTGAESLPLPVTWALVSTGEPLGPVSVKAEALLTGTVVVERRAVTRFLEGQALTLRLLLEGVCRGENCVVGETCVAGACVPAAVDANLLPPWPNEQLCDCVTPPRAEVTCASGSCEIAQCEPGWSEADGNFENGCEMCVDDGCGCGATIMCDDCECEGGCGCEYECQDMCKVTCNGTDTTCNVNARGIKKLDKLTCEMSASCSVDGTGARELKVDCKSESTCTIDATDADKCDIKCDSDAQCILINPGSECGYSRCDAELTCPGGQVVCNTTCP